MKKLLVILTSILVITACASTKEARLSRAELRNEKKLAEQEVVKKAVEAKRYIIKLNRLYFSLGGMIDLRPRTNYIIVDGNNAIICAAYLGRQYEIKPIAAINLIGKTKDYQLTNFVSNGKYEIKMKVDNGRNSFDVYLTINKNGSCNVSFNTLMIDIVNYSGYLVPIKDKNSLPLQETNVI
jgi:hypothetical protein